MIHIFFNDLGENLMEYVFYEVFSCVAPEPLFPYFVLRCLHRIPAKTWKQRRTAAQYALKREYAAIQAELWQDLTLCPCSLRLWVGAVLTCFASLPAYVTDGSVPQLRTDRMPHEIADRNCRL